MNARKNAMRVRKPHPVRTKIDMADEKQLRLVRKRFGISDADLIRIANKVGNSITAIRKEVQLERASRRDATVAQVETSNTALP